jgi:biotin carboxyl carrier protein
VRLLITLEGKSYEVAVDVLPENSGELWDEETGVAIPDSVLLPPLLPDMREVDKICRCPIAGAIVSVEVAVGAHVHQGDPVAIIDAMKMQTMAEAPVDGTVVEIQVKAGDAVRPGQVLCRLE